MVDETAKTNLTFDASGAQKGAADFKTAAEQVIAANKGMSAAAQDAARLQAAAAKNGGDAVITQTDRVVKSLGSQTTFLNNLARSFDPLAPAAQRASGALGTLLDIVDKGGRNAERAMSLLAPATDRAVKAQMDMAAGVRQSASELARLTEKFDPVGASVARMAKDLGDLGQALKGGVVEASQYEKELDKIILKYDEGAQAAKQFAAAQREVIESSRAAQSAATAQQQGQSMFDQFAGVRGGTLGSIGGRTVTDDPFKSAEESASVFTAELDRVEAEYNKVTEAALRTAAAQKTMIDQARAAQTASNSQTAINQLTGVQSGPGKSAQQSASVFEEREKLLQQFPTLETATASYHAKLTDIDRAIDLGTITQARATAERTKATASLDAAKKGVDPLTGALKGYAASSSQADFATRQFGVQTVQFFSSLQAGTPFMIAFIQQAHQVLDVSLATGTGFSVLTGAVKMAFNAITGFIMANPITAIGAVITAVTVGAVIAAESAARRLNTLTQELRAFTTDYKALAESIEEQARRAAANTGLSRSEAAQAGQILSTSPNAPAQSQLSTLLPMVADIAKVFTAGDIPAAAHKLALAFADPAKAASELAKNQLPQMSAALAREVELLTLQGHTIEATNIVLNAYKDATNKAADALTPLQEVWKGITQIASSLGSALLGLTNGVLGLVGRMATAAGNMQDIEANASPWARRDAGGVRPAGAGGTGDLFSVVQSQLGKTDTTIGAFLKDNGQTLDAAQNAWCAAFVNAALRSLGIQGTGSNMASSFLAFGDKVESVARNDVLVQTRNLPGGISGHVGIASGQTRIGPNGQLQYGMTSGNQNNQVQQSFINASDVQIRRSAAAQGGAAQLSPAEQADAASRDQRTRLGDAQTRYNATQPGTKETNAAAIAGLVDLQTHVEAGSKAYDQLTVTIGLLRGANENSRTPTEAYNKTLQEQTDLMKTEGGAATQVANILKAADEAKVAQTGHHLDAAEKASFEAKAYAGLNETMKLNIDQTNRSTAATQGSIGLLIGGTKAADDYNAKIKAQNDAIQFVARGAPGYDAAVKSLTATNIAAADAERLKTAAEQATGNNAEVTRTRLRAQIEELKTYRDAQGRTTEEVRVAGLAIEELSGKLATARTPAEEMTHQTQLAGNVAGLAAGATRDLAQAIQELNEKEIARTGHGATQAQIAELTNAKLREYDGRVKEAIRANAIAIVSNNEMATAIEAGGRAVDAANAAIKARTVALQAGKEGSAEYNAALKATTESNIAVAQSERDKAAATDTGKIKDEIEFTRTEIDLLNASVEVRNRELAILRERQALQLKPGEVPTARQQGALDATGKLADITTFRDNTKKALDDVTGMFSQSFDTIGNAITDALVSGQGKAINFRDVMVSVAQQILQQFLKLAAINPLMNSIFPGSEHRSTLTDLINGLEGTKPANDNTSGGLGGLGGAGGLAGKAAGLLGGAKAGPGFLERTYNSIFGIKPAGQSAITDLKGGVKDTTVIQDSMAEGSKSITEAVQAAAPDLGQAVAGAGKDIAKEIGSVAPEFASVFKSVVSASSTSGGSGGGLGGLGDVAKGIGSLFGKSGGGAVSAFAGTDLDLAGIAASAASAGPSIGAFGSLGIGGVLPAIYHEGGLVGHDNVPQRLAPLPDLASLPRFHSGLGGDEFAAILQRGERVLTGGQQARVSAAANSNGSNGPVVMNFNFPNNASPDQFRRAGQQVAGQVEGALARANKRNRSA